MYLSYNLLRPLSGFLLFLFLVMPGPAMATNWKVAFLVPEGERGTAFSQAAGLYLRGLQKKGDGGVDPIFVSMGRTSDSCSFEALPILLEGKNVIAAVSLLRGESVPCLQQVMEGEKIPLLMVWSERIDLPDSLFFSLDFPESFRVSAIPLWAGSLEKPNWTLFVDGLDRRSKNMDRLTGDRFFSEKIEYRSMEFLRNSKYGFRNSSKDRLVKGSENFLSWLAPSDTVLLKRTLFSLGAFNTRLVHGGQRQDLFLGVDGVTIFSQDPFPGEEFLERIRDEQPSDLMNRISPAELVKTRAAILWLSKALSDLSEGSSSEDLSSSLEKVRSISLPGFFAEFREDLHRPIRKSVFILRSHGGQWVEEDRIYLEVLPDGICSIVQ